MVFYNLTEETWCRNAETVNGDYRTRRRRLCSSVPGTGHSKPGPHRFGARDNLKEAQELFFETASIAEIEERLHSEVYVTQVEVGAAQA